MAPRKFPFYAPARLNQTCFRDHDSGILDDSCFIIVDDGHNKHRLSVRQVFGLKACIDEQWSALSTIAKRATPQALEFVVNNLAAFYEITRSGKGRGNWHVKKKPGTLVREIAFHTKANRFRLRRA